MAKKGNDENSNKRIPQRVENAAKSMINQASSGPRRGYIPPEPGRTMPTQQNGYSAQSTQTPFGSGQSTVTGSQRGFIMPVGQASKPKKQKKKHTGLAVFLVFLFIAALGIGGYFIGTVYLRNKEISE